MRTKTVDMLKRIKGLLWESKEYLRADVIAEKCHMSVTSVYRCIRLLRLEGVGVHITPQGYVLSEVAQKKDDTHLLRRINGRRVSDLIALSAAAPHIRKRWRGVEDRRHMKTILDSLASDRGILDSGLETIALLEEKHGL